VWGSEVRRGPAVSQVILLTDRRRRLWVSRPSGIEGGSSNVELSYGDVAHTGHLPARPAGAVSIRATYSTGSTYQRSGPLGGSSDDLDRGSTPRGGADHRRGRATERRGARDRAGGVGPDR
jgi:hypothetical protein